MRSSMKSSSSQGLLINVIPDALSFTTGPKPPDLRRRTCWSSFLSELLLWCGSGIGMVGLRYTLIYDSETNTTAQEPGNPFFYHRE
jgi:hypothetical protein